MLLVAAAGLEVAYCGLLRVTPLKTVLSGCNVAVGGLAGLYAVALAPSPGLVLLYFLWALSWEMGCRNMPNDWVDYNEDVALGIKTIAVRFGLSRAARYLICHDDHHGDFYGAFSTHVANSPLAFV